MGRGRLEAISGYRLFCTAMQCRQGAHSPWRRKDSAVLKIDPSWDSYQTAAPFLPASKMCIFFSLSQWLTERLRIEKALFSSSQAGEGKGKFLQVPCVGHWEPPPPASSSSWTGTTRMACMAGGFAVGKWMFLCSLCPWELLSGYLLCDSLSKADGPPRGSFQVAPLAGDMSRWPLPRSWSCGHQWNLWFHFVQLTDS